MKIKIIILMTFLLLFSTNLLARDSTQPSSLNLIMSLKITVLDLESEPEITARGRGNVEYYLTGKKSAIIEGISLPNMVYQTDEPPLDFEDLTILIDGMAGNKPIIDWSSAPPTILENVDLLVRAYETKRYNIKPNTEPIMDIVLKDLTFTTGSIEIDGYIAEGEVNGTRMSAKLVGTTRLPFDKFEPYKKWLAGKRVLLELYIKLPIIAH